MFGIQLIVRRELITYTQPPGSGPSPSACLSRTHSAHRNEHPIVRRCHSTQGAQLHYRARMKRYLAHTRACARVVDARANDAFLSCQELLPTLSDEILDDILVQCDFDMERAYACASQLLDEAPAGDDGTQSRSSVQDQLSYHPFSSEHTMVVVPSMWDHAERSPSNSTSNACDDGSWLGLTDFFGSSKTTVEKATMMTTMIAPCEEPDITGTELL